MKQYLSNSDINNQIQKLHICHHHQESIRTIIAYIAEINGRIDGYTIHTVITLDMAYLDARLVCRPEAEWLAINTID